MGLPTMFLGRGWHALRCCRSQVYARGCSCGPNTPKTPITPTTPTPNGDNVFSVSEDTTTPANVSPFLIQCYFFTVFLLSCGLHTAQYYRYKIVY